MEKRGALEARASRGGAEGPAGVNDDAGNESVSG